GKLDFFVADLRNLGDRAFEIILHQVADGVELHSNLIDLVLGGPTESGREQRRGRGGAGYFQKTASVHGVKPHDCVPPGGPHGAEVNSEELYAQPLENRYSKHFRGSIEARKLCEASLRITRRSRTRRKSAITL